MVEKNRYWLWIIPTNKCEGLWDLCIKNSILAAHYPYKEIKERKKLWDMKEIEEGDYIVAYLNNRTIGGIGRVKDTLFDATDSYNWKSEINYTADHLTAIKVKWELKDDKGIFFDDKERIFDLIGINILYTTTVHPMLPKYFSNTKNWLKKQISNIEDTARYQKRKKSNNLISAQDLRIREFALRDFITEHIEDIFGEKWDIFEDEKGTEGIEYRLKSGEADIILIDPEDNVVIVELKVIVARKAHVEQLVSYCNEYEELCGEKAYGILLAPEITIKAEKTINKNESLQFRQFNLFIEFERN